MESEAPAPLGVLLISGSHERAHYAFVLTTTAAALGRAAVLFATNAGLRGLCHGADEEQEKRLRAAGVATLEELREAAAELGVRRIACEAGLRVEGIPETSLLPGVEVAGVATFLSALGKGQVMTL